MKRDFQKSRIIWYLLFSYTRLRCLHCVMKPQNFTETLTSQLSKKRWANSSAYLHFNHTLCRFSISLSLSLPLPLSVSLFLSLSHKKECHFVSGFLCLFSPEWWFKHWRWVSERFSSTCLYSIDAQMKFNGQNTANSHCVCLGAFSHLPWKNDRLIRSIWKESDG